MIGQLDKLCHIITSELPVIIVKHCHLITFNVTTE